MKIYSPAVLEALRESLWTAYWFKGDLKSFVSHVAVPTLVANRLPWDQPKRVIVRELVDALAADQLTTKPVLDAIIGALVEQDASFPRLAKLEDGPRKVREARTAQARLKELVGVTTIAERAEHARADQRTEAARASAQAKARSEELRALRTRFHDLAMSTDTQRRGYQFQELLRDLFALYDLEPRGSFAYAGEQTDGRLILDGTVFLVEARWTAARSDPREVREFRTKVHDKLDSTLGLFISMAGFTDEAVTSASGGGRILVLLMDGPDLAAVFEGHVGLVDLLHRKRRHASDGGGAMYRAGQQ